MSREIGGVHANALCEKYGNNIAEAKQNSLSLHMKYTQDRAFLQPPSPSPSYSSRPRHETSGARPRLLLSSLFLKHLICRDLENAPRIRPMTPTEYKCGFRWRRCDSRWISDEKTGAHEARRREKRDLRVVVTRVISRDLASIRYLTSLGWSDVNSVLRICLEEVPALQ